ncbi:hypothetical protein ACIO3R_01555 [Streptomyces sp. NPDC087428]|uniref:hypothetical protein n=1 Tax=Streptomyces sp. NPDC087428 TaxID=3365788 RepID=UPI00380A4C62
MTTAQKLNTFRRELLDGGMDPNTTEHLVRDAAHSLVASEGLQVSRTNPPEVITGPTHS